MNLCYTKLHIHLLNSHYLSSLVHLKYIKIIKVLRFGEQPGDSTQFPEGKLFKYLVETWQAVHLFAFPPSVHLP